MHLKNVMHANTYIRGYLMLTLYIANVEKDVSMKNLSPKEAITILEEMRIDIPVPKAAVTQIKRNLALNMAINALNCSEIPNNSDTISRQAAIDAVIKWFGCEPSDIGAFENIIEKLPSAQPEIIRCKDCRYYIGNRCYKFKALDDLRSNNDYCSAAERREE